MFPPPSCVNVQRHYSFIKWKRPWSGFDTLFLALYPLVVRLSIQFFIFHPMRRKGSWTQWRWGRMTIRYDTCACAWLFTVAVNMKEHYSDYGLSCVRFNFPNKGGVIFFFRRCVDSGDGRRSRRWNKWASTINLSYLLFQPSHRRSIFLSAIIPSFRRCLKRNTPLLVYITTDWWWGWCWWDRVYGGTWRKVRNKNDTDFQLSSS